MMLQTVVEVAGKVCVMRIVQYSLKQLIVSLLQQLIEVCWFPAEGLASRRCGSIAAGLAAGGQQQQRRSTERISRCGQWHVVS